MSEAWSQWEGQVIDGRFLLKQRLGGSGPCAVFLTQICPREEASASEPIPLAIKLIAAEPIPAARQLSRWRLAQLLSHPNLLRVFDAGRCRLGDTDLIFGVTEYADENLAQILPQRPLTAEEASSMLKPALDALAYLHGQGLAHGRLTPANVMAIGDELKLASDWICPANQVVAEPGTPGVYDAPETANGTRSPAADVWSLGMVLSEVLTQCLPSRNRGKSGQDAADPVLPENLPATFAEIVRGCLRCDVQQRLTADGIQALLHGGTPRQASAEATAGPQKPVASSQKPAPQKTAASSSSVAASPTVKQRESAREYPQRIKPRGTGFSSRAALAAFLSWTAPLLRRFAVPLAVAVAALVALYAGMGLLHRDPGAGKDAASVQPEQQPAQPTPMAKPQPAAWRSEGKPSPRSDANRGSKAGGTEGKAQNGVANVDARTSRDLGVVQPVLPRASQSALDTIQGTIRVSVRVKVDPAGNVAGAELVSHGPSPYFARLSLDAARDWKFDPSRGIGRPVLLHFEFRNSGTRGFATR